MLPGWLALDERSTPSAHVVLVRGDGAPFLVDCGGGTVDATGRTEAFLAGHGVSPGDLAAVVCTHFHDDHVGGCAWLQGEHGVPVLAHAAEAALVNARDPRACDAAWLGLDVGPYEVDVALEDGDELDLGPGFEVVAVPSQTPGHLALWQPEDRVLITGDLLQDRDVAWVPVGGPWADGALERSIAAIERLAALQPRVVVPGHGPVVTDPAAAVERALARYGRWRERPEEAAWHFARRVVVGGLAMGTADPADLAGRFAVSPCLADAARVAGLETAAFLQAVVDPLLARGALELRDGRLGAAVAHEPPSPLRVGPGRPAAWPPPSSA